MRLVQVAPCRWKRTEGNRVMARSNATKPSRVCLRCSWIASLALAMTDRQRELSQFSSPSPREAVGREGRREAEARVGGSSCNPHPGSLSLADPPHKGEGEETLRLGREALRSC